METTCNTTQLEEIIKQAEKDLKNMEEYIYKKYKYKIIKKGKFNNGYIKIPYDHIYYAHNFNDVDIKVEGGLSFSGITIPEDPTREGGWWLGFSTYNKDINFIKKECERIIDQLINITKKLETKRMKLKLEQLKTKKQEIEKEIKDVQKKIDKYQN